MTRQFLACSLLPILALFSFSADVSAQNFIPQTRAIPGAGYGTHADAMRVLGPAASHRGNQGLPTRDTFGGQAPQRVQLQQPMSNGSTGWRGNTIWNRGDAGGNSSFGQPWRGNTIFNPGARNYNYQPQQFDAARLQQSIQQFSNALQQVRQNRQNYQRQYGNYYNNNFRRW